MNSLQNYGSNVNPSFGHFEMSNRAKRVFQDKIKSKKGWKKLDELIKSQDNNPVPICIDLERMENGKTKLFAKIGNYQQFDKFGIDTDKTFLSRNIESFFFNPIGYVKKLCKTANERAQSLTEFNDILKYVKEKSV